MPSVDAVRAQFLAATGTAYPRTVALLAHPRLHQRLIDMGKERGIAFAFDRIERSPNTLDAHRVIRWAQSSGKQDALVERLFKLYFEEGRDIGDIETLVECALRCGIDEATAREFFASDEGRQEVVASDVYARRLGINGVPCFIVNRKYAVSGAQPPSAFVEVFNLAERDAATSAAQSTA